MELEFNLFLDYPFHMVWEAWTDSNKVSSWLARHANIILRKNGQYELEIDDNHSTKGCRIIQIQPPSLLEEIDQKALLEISWKANDQFEDINIYDLTTVKLIFSTKGEVTKFSLIHYGWKSSEDYQKAREWHSEWWPEIMQKLQIFLKKADINH